MRASRFMLWVSVTLFAAFGLLAVDSTQLLLGRERAGEAMFAPMERLISHGSDVVGNFAATVQEMGQLRTENRVLRAENARLKAENIAAQQIMAENVRLRGLVGFEHARPGHRYVPARVIGHGGDNLLPMLTIDVGSTSGVRRGMAVVAPAGLVGRIVAVGSSWSQVLPMNNPSSSVAAVVSGTAGPATGMVQVEPNRGIALTLVPSSAHLRPGDWVLTSGTGGGFPPNLPIGYVVSTRQQDVALFQTAVLRLAVNIDHVQDILVVTDFVPANVPA